jgi:hypothetical protein
MKEPGVGFMKCANQVVAFLRSLDRFEYRLSVMDHVWDLYFPDRQERWSHLQIVKYGETFYLDHIDGETPGLEVVPGKSVSMLSDFGRPVYIDEESAIEQWSLLLKNAGVWLKKMEKDWVRSNKQVQAEYPLARRYGIVPHSLVRASLSEFFRFDEELGKRRCRKFIRLVEEGAFFTTDDSKSRLSPLRIILSIAGSHTSQQNEKTTPSMRL